MQREEYIVSIENGQPTINGKFVNESKAEKFVKFGDEFVAESDFVDVRLPSSLYLLLLELLAERASAAKIRDQDATIMDELGLMFRGRMNHKNTDWRKYNEVYLKYFKSH